MSDSQSHRAMLIALKGACLVAVGALLAGDAAAADPPAGFDYGVSFRAIENYCAWPNLTEMADGTIIAMVHNKPAHGNHPQSKIECWASVDGGWTWKLRGAPSQPHCYHTAAGLDADGKLICIVLTSDGKDRKMGKDNLCFNSTDGGRTWKQLCREIPAGTPFGDVIVGKGGSLRASVYLGSWAADGESCYFIESNDNGETWHKKSLIDRPLTEAASVHLGKGNWLVAGRTGPPDYTEFIKLYRSKDDGASWKFERKLTGPGEHPGHLLRLADGRILLTYGDRTHIKFGGVRGIEVLLSSDEGQTWSEPLRLPANVGGFDLGYPASVQRADGKIVTAYYSSNGGYHMGVVVWDLKKTLKDVFGKKAK